VGGSSPSEFGRHGVATNRGEVVPYDTLVVAVDAQAVAIVLAARPRGRPAGQLTLSRSSASSASNGIRGFVRRLASRNASRTSAGMAAR
jgi:hypothetical protein